MKPHRAIFLLACLSIACTPDTTIQRGHLTQSLPKLDAYSLQTLHVRLSIRPEDGGVSYFGWYDGKRNLLGPAGIIQVVKGMEPPELKGEIKKIGENEILFEGTDQNQIVWQKQYRLEDNTVHATIKITSKRDQPFDAIITSYSDLPDSTITGTPRDQNISSPIASAHFHADIDTTRFPGESMNPFTLRSDQRRLEPGDSLEFHMTWELALPKQ
jgi:hypothetical protein